ncbi:MAG: cobyrinate a,c-diamide synthase [Desulfomonile tiedjei]|nr:cobyrinate a,c-diamide synthase [Desulfomonile tiedjei]
MSCPRIVIAGANSGVGKTTVSLGLVVALKKRGLKVQTFKVGPDYLDPTYLSLASERPCYNLDGWMTGNDYVQDLFARASADADIAVIEGVMGLFDGADFDSLEGSTAQIAMWLDSPVLLLVNVHGVARSLAPIVKGFAEFEPSLNIAGVISNHCGSARHGEWLAEALKFSRLPQQVGAVPRGAFSELPNRHLGLVTADTGILTPTILDSLGEAVERHLNVAAILKKAQAFAPFQHTNVTAAPQPSGRPVRIGLACDQAFHFYYLDNLEEFERNGCDLIRFSPLEDSELPRGIDGIYIGGGYPEEFAERLAQNTKMLRAFKDFGEAGKPIYAECGGLMYLAQGIETLDGKRHNLVGLFPAWTRMLDRLRSLGYVEVKFTHDSLFGKRGDKLRGHEFHYSELVGEEWQESGWTAAYNVQHRRATKAVPEGFQKGRILVSYIHMHFASKPESIRHFLGICREGVR